MPIYNGEGQDDSQKETSVEMNPKAPSQAELDADRAANPDTSEEKSKEGSG